MVESKPDTKRLSLPEKLNHLIAQGSHTLSAISFLNTEYDGMSDPDPVEKIILTSYPRCGNTLLRTYLEQLTRIHTGSDCDLRRPMNKQLKDMGMHGEGQYGDRVWIVKTHFPERIGRAKFKAHKCIVIVRNPLDSMYSLFNMIQTSSHNESIAKDVHDIALKSKIWEDFVTQETTVWRDFHDYWLKETLPIETYFVTYESLLEEPQKTLTGLLQFLLNRHSLEGMSIQNHIE